MHAMEFFGLQLASTNKWYWGEIVQIYKEWNYNKETLLSDTEPHFGAFICRHVYRCITMSMYIL